MRILTTFFLFFFSYQCFGQLDIDINVTESTCENNGTAIVRVNGAMTNNGETNVTLILTEGPMDMGEVYPIILSHPDRVFSALSPGVYTLEVYDNYNNSDVPEVREFTIDGDYESMQIIADLTNEGCEYANDGAIKIDVENGRGPFSITLYNLIDTSLIQATMPGHFTDLDSGNYFIVVEDACFNTRTKTVTLTTDIQVNTGTAMVQDITYDCDYVYINVKAIDVELEALLLIYTGGSEYVSMEVISPIEHNYVFERPYDEIVNQFGILNSCNEIEVKFQKTSEFHVEDIYVTSTCDSILWDPIDYHLFSTSPVFGEIIEYPPGYDGITTVDIDDEIWVAPGLYTILYTDSCGHEKLIEYDLKIPTPNIIYSYRGGNCTEELSTLQLQGMIFPPNQVNILNAPEGFDHPLNFTTEDFFISYGNVPEGYYSFEIINSCSDTVALDFKLEDPLYDFSSYVELIPGCEGQNTVRFSYENNIDDGKYLFKLKNLENNQLQGGFYEEEMIDEINYLSAGEYLISFNDAKIGDLCDTAFYLTIPEYETPQIFAANIYLCNEDSLSTTAAVVGGIAPYQYDLIDNDTDEILIEGQESPLFDGLEKDRNYRIRVTDDCGNSSSQDVNIVPIGLQQELGGVHCITDGEPFPVIVYEYAATDYTWILPDRRTINRADLSNDLTEMDSTDVGTYTLIIDFNDGCRKDTIEIDLIMCDLLPVEWLDFTAQTVNTGVLLSWSTASEVDNDYFRIKRSKDGKEWKEIGREQGKGTTNELNHYQFVDTQPENGRNYYRITQVDFDSKSEHSEVESINFQIDRINAYTSSQLPGSVIITGGIGEQVSIYSRDGTLIKNQMIISDYQTIDDLQVKPGIYFVTTENRQLFKVYIY